MKYINRYLFRYGTNRYGTQQRVPEEKGLLKQGLLLLLQQQRVSGKTQQAFIARIIIIMA